MCCDRRGLEAFPSGAADTPDIVQNGVLPRPHGIEARHHRCHDLAMGMLVGLTGGIGSGKSTVGGQLVALGAALVDADAIVHELQAPGQPVFEAIVEEFGTGVVTTDGALDRPALGTIVFGDESARQRLGELTHGPVIAEMANRAQRALDAGAPLVVLDVPLLFEGRAAGRGSTSTVAYERTVLVWVPPEVQLERTVARDGCTADEASKRIAAQLPIDSKRELADHVIDNSGSPEETARQVEDLYATLTNIAAS